MDYNKLSKKNKWTLMKYIKEFDLMVKYAYQLRLGYRKGQRDRQQERERTAPHQSRPRLLIRRSRYTPVTSR